MSDDTPQQRLEDVLEAFDIAMLTTQTGAGRLRARPMAIAKRRGADALYFATDDDSGKLDELRQHPQIAAVMQGGSRFLSLSGTGSVVRDRERVRECWNPAWKIWFPNGPDDPSLVLVKLDADAGEYWDTSGSNRLKFIYEAGKALLKGEAMSAYDKDLHEKVAL